MAAPQRDRNGQGDPGRSGDGERYNHRNRCGNDCDNRRGNNENEHIKHVIIINHVSKVVRGGRCFSLAALVVVGDDEGTVGIGYGKAKEAPQATSESVEKAKENFIRVPMVRHIITHLVESHATVSVILLRPATPKTGVTAGGPVRAALEAVDVHNMLAKSPGSANAINIIHATVDALRQLEQSGAVAARRGLSFERAAPTSILRACMEGEAEKRIAAEQAEAEKASAGVSE